MTCAQSTGRVILVQPIVPVYRVPYFNRLFSRFGESFRVYASPCARGNAPPPDGAWEYELGPIRTLLPGVEWQSGALSVPIARNDLVVVSGAPRCLTNMLLLLKARLAGARTMWWGHYWSSTSRPWRARLRLLIAQLANALLFYTDREVEEYRERYGDISNRPVAALNNGIETNEIAKLRTPFDPKVRGHNILFISRLTKKCELPLLLRALADPSCREVTLHVVGDGEDGERARSLASSLGLEARVRWHGALHDEAHIAEVANGCALLVYPGSVGLSLIHAFAYGLPAIVHDDPLRHGPEIAALEVSHNGNMFRKADAQSLAQTIASTLSETDQLSAMSANAVATTNDTYNARDMAERFCAAIEEVRHRAH
jgi:glycosyltransferase involved in cell wall biosynthesis